VKLAVSAAPGPVMICVAAIVAALESGPPKLMNDPLLYPNHPSTRGSHIQPAVTCMAHSLHGGAARLNAA